LIQTHLASNEKLLPIVQQKYRRMMEWDQAHHTSSAWMTSGHPLTYPAVFTLLYPNHHFTAIQNGAPLSNQPTVCLWGKKLDVWSRRNHGYEQELEQHFRQFFCSTKTRDELDQIVWTHDSSLSTRPSRWIGKLWIK